MTNNRNPELDHPLEITKMYHFNSGATDYIFVRWAANPNYCSFNATLFEAFGYGDNPSLKIVSTNGYGCGWL